MLPRLRTILFVVLSGAVAQWELVYSAEQPPAQGKEKAKWQILEWIGNGFVAAEGKPPDLPVLKKDLSKAQRLENFEILWEAIDRHYSFFDLKSIDWQKIKKRYHVRVKAATTDDAYYRVLSDLVRELKDAHSYPCNYQVNLPGFRPNVCTHQIEGKAVVTYVTEGSEAYVKGLRPGAIITCIDGLSVPEKVEQLRPVLWVCSSERTFQAIAYCRLLDGEKGTKVKVTFLPPGEEHAVEAELQRTATMPWRQPWQYRTMLFPVDKGKFLWFGTHPSGYGYIRIVSFKGREEIADEFDRALEKLKDTPGLIIDIRDNHGGSGAPQPRMIGRLITARTRVATSFEKNGPGHQDFRRCDRPISPTGQWQYTKPVAMLTNAITGSASDLFACRMCGTGRVITVGTTTHGNLPGRSVRAVLPCGLVVRISNSYVTDIHGRIIEVNGTTPQIHAEPTVKDVVNGTDSVIARAVQALGEATSHATSVCDGPNGICNLPDQPLGIPSTSGKKQGPDGKWPFSNAPASARIDQCTRTDRESSFQVQSLRPMLKTGGDTWTGEPFSKVR